MSQGRPLSLSALISFSLLWLSSCLSRICLFFFLLHLVLFLRLFCPILLQFPFSFTSFFLVPLLFLLLCLFFFYHSFLPFHSPIFFSFYTIHSYSVYHFSFSLSFLFLLSLFPILLIPFSSLSISSSLIFRMLSLSIYLSIFFVSSHFTYLFTLFSHNTRHGGCFEDPLKVQNQREMISN